MFLWRSLTPTAIAAAAAALTRAKPAGTNPVTPESKSGGVAATDQIAKN